MAHIRLNLVVQAHRPDVHARARKRLRKLRGIRPSRANELWYKAELLKVVRAIHDQTRAALLPVIKDWCRAHQPTIGDAALPPTVREKFERMARSFGHIDTTAKRLASAAAKRNLDEVDKRLAAEIGRSVGVNIKSVFTQDGAIRTKMATAIKDNVELINSIPTEYFAKLEKNLMAHMQEGVRWEDLADQLEHTGEVTESRAKLIARDQTSKMNSAFNEERQTSIGIEEYQWQTSGDERVRDSHAEKDGQIFSWDNPPEDTGHPGEDIQCRCVALPIFNLDAEEAELA